MKENKVIITGLLAVIGERIIYFALPTYLNFLKWILLEIVVVCIILYFKLSK